jgi:hypothetical protein
MEMSGLSNANKEFQEPEKIKEVKLYYDPKKKKMQADWKGLKNAAGYFYQFYTSPINPDNTVLKADTLKGRKAVISGLPRGQRVLFRVRIVTRASTGPWSEPLEKRVP